MSPGEKLAAAEARATEAAAAASAREAELRASRAGIEQRLQDQLAQRDAEARSQAAELTLEIERLQQRADAQQQQSERLAETLRQQLCSSEERLTAAQARLEETAAAVDELRGELAVSNGRVSELEAALAAEQEASESRTATLRSAAGSELQRTSRELEVALDAEASASALSERMGRAAASANAATAEAERERDEARDELRAAFDTREALEGELAAQREGGAALSERVAELTAELREAAEAGGRAAADADAEVQVRRCFLTFPVVDCRLAAWLFCARPCPSRDTLSAFCLLCLTAECGQCIDPSSALIRCCGIAYSSLCAGMPWGPAGFVATPLSLFASQKRLFGIETNVHRTSKKTHRRQAARGREEELAQRLAEALLALDDAEARLVEMRQWEDAEAAWAREKEASRRREAGLGAAREDAEAARERAERRAEEALSELGKRNGEKQVGIFWLGLVLSWFGFGSVWFGLVSVRFGLLQFGLVFVTFSLT